MVPYFFFDTFQSHSAKSHAAQAPQKGLQCVRKVYSRNIHSLPLFATVSVADFFLFVEKQNFAQHQNNTNTRERGPRRASCLFGVVWQVCPSGRFAVVFRSQSAATARNKNGNVVVGGRLYKIIIKITYTFTKSQLKSPLKKHSPCCKIKSHHNITETVILKSPPYFLKHQVKNRKNILSGKPSYTLCPNSRSNLSIFCL